MRIKEALTYFLSSDSYTHGGGYWIRSLYFDTPHNKEYIEKVVGLEKRKKIRLRIYSLNSQKVKLEIKNKYNEYMKKETVVVTREEASRLVRGDYGFLLNSENPILNRVYYFMAKKYYQPVVIVDYKRDAFVGSFNNIRITFDRQIEGCTTEMDLFKKDLHKYRVFDDSTIVMEVKYNLFLPAWLKEILSRINTDNSSISKYCLCRDACLMNI